MSMIRLALFAALLGTLSACEASTASTSTPVADAGASQDAAVGQDTGSNSTDTASGTGTDTTAPTKLTWANVSGIFAATCATCHPAPAKTFDATNCAQVAAATKIKGQVSTGLMPPAGSKKPTADEKATILKWIADGSSCTE